MPRPPSVVVTGVGATSAFGRGAGALRDGVFAGREVIAPIGRFDVAPFGARGVAALVPGGPERDRHAAWAVEAGREALAMAGLGDASRGGRRVALVMGTSLGRGDDLTETTAAVARSLGLDGPRVTFSTACTSSANAVGFARDLVASGDVDAALAGGADEVTLDLFAGFAALGVLAEGPCAPFGPVFGTTLGEGAGFVVLERAGEGTATPLAELAGYGLAGDAFHETSPDPRGGGVARAMRGALGDAGWRAEDVDYVNAHGTGTAANDEAEWLGTEAALGPRARAIPVSASKGMFGHAQGAAGVLELLATLACVAEGAVPPSVRAERGRRRGPADAAAGPRPRPHAVARFLSTSSAFGGANAVLAVGPRGDAERPMRPVSLLSDGTVAGADAVARARTGEGLRAVAPSLDPRTLDPLARLAVCACGEAWAALPSRPAGAARDRAGVILAAPRVSPTSARAWRDALRERGPTRVDARAFARLVLHATTGTASQALSLRGPASTLAGSGAAGVAAVIAAARVLAWRDDADLMLAGYAEERDDADPAREGASVVCLGTSPAPGAPRVAGTAFAGPGRVDEARARAAGGRDDVPWRVVRAEPDAPLAAMEALRAAARDVRNGAPRAGVVALDDHLTCALVLENAS
ncbi:MAG: beta-ketoacyl-[acyl-carrier-protein] synthase family protein [Polyangiales bacterium]